MSSSMDQRSRWSACAGMPTPRYIHGDVAPEATSTRQCSWPSKKDRTWSSSLAPGEAGGSRSRAGVSRRRTYEKPSDRAVRSKEGEAMLAESLSLDGAVVAVIAVAVLFGAKRLPELARSVGRAQG